MVGEFVTRKERAMQGCNPRRIHVTRTPRPDSRGKDAHVSSRLCGSAVRLSCVRVSRDEAETKTLLRVTGDRSRQWQLR